MICAALSTLESLDLIKHFLNEREVLYKQIINKLGTKYFNLTLK